MYRKIRRKALVFVRNTVLATLTAAALIYLIFSPEEIKFLLPQKDIQRVSANDIKTEKIYSLDTNVIVDCFAENADGLFYTVPAGDDKYIAVYVPNMYTELTDSIAYDTWGFLMENSDVMPESHFRTKGVVYNLDDELYGYMCDGAAEIELTEKGSEDELLLKYVFCAVSEDELPDAWDYAFAAFLAAALLLDAALLIAAAFGVPTWRVKKYIRSGDISEADVENEYEKGIDTGNIIVGELYTFVQPIFFCRIIANSEVIRVYMKNHDTADKSYGIKKGSTVNKSVFIALNTGRVYKCVCASEDEANSVVERYSSACGRISEEA